MVHAKALIFFCIRNLNQGYFSVTLSFLHKQKYKYCVPVLNLVQSSMHGQKKKNPDITTRLKIWSDFLVAITIPMTPNQV